MTGKELSNKIRQLNYSNAQIARLLSISEQALNSKLKTSDAKFSFIKELAAVTNTSVYDWLNEPIPANGVPQDKTDYRLKYLQLLEEYKNLSDKLAACLENTLNNHSHKKN